jgi:hypothetical protein
MPLLCSQVVWFSGSSSLLVNTACFIGHMQPLEWDGEENRTEKEPGELVVPGLHGVQDFDPQEVQMRPTEHLPLEKFEAIDMPFHDSV